MTKLLSDVISNESYSTTGYNIVIRNESTQTQIIKPELIAIKELMDNGIILEMPINSCQITHLLSIFFLNPETQPAVIKLPLKGAYKAAVLEAISRVEQIERHDSNNKLVLVNIVFTQIDIPTWQKILDQYSANQDKINELIMKQFTKR